MKAHLRGTAAVLVMMLLVGACAASAPPDVLAATSRFTDTVALPKADVAGTASLEQAIANRRSIRDYVDQDLTLDEIGQLLWAGQGVTDADGHRAAPSAGARYPLELYVVTQSQVMHYLPATHAVESRPDSRVVSNLRAAAFDQAFVAHAPAVIVIAAVADRTELEYGAVARRLVDREAGHAAQNILLQATALGLGAVPVGGLDPSRVEALLALPPDHEVLYLIPVGRPLA